MAEQKIPAGVVLTAEKQLTVLVEAFVSISYLGGGRSFFHTSRPLRLVNSQQLRDEMSAREGQQLE